MFIVYCILYLISKNNNFKFDFYHFSGDVLAIEKPYVGVLRKESFEHNCYYCFKRCLSGIPCSKCTLVKMYYNISTFFIKSKIKSFESFQYYDN